MTDDVFTEHSFTKPALNDGSWITTCGGKSVLGGYGKFGKDAISTKEYSGLPEHSGIIVSFKTYFVDSWDNERLYLKVEG